MHTSSRPDDAAAEAALVGIDWGTTQRRVMALDRTGRWLREFSDDEGLLKAVGRFRPALEVALQRIAPLADAPRVLLAGMRCLTSTAVCRWRTCPRISLLCPMRPPASTAASCPACAGVVKAAMST